ncbi:MAG: peptidase T [Anaerolineae bacterium]|nr:peptidase T [Anaerolineae bacterium]
MPKNFLKELEDRFLRYVQIDTQSKENSDETPSTAKQFDLLRLLVNELIDLGAKDVALTDTGYALATIPATVPTGDIPTVAFFAHVDTAPAYNGANVKPIIHRNYDGAPITFCHNPDLVLAEDDFTYLQTKHGDDIVTASGDTLLGADDKAGVAIIMTMAAHLLANPEIPHGEIRICFNPDEEVGRGVVNLELEELGANVAYTLDGAQLGEVCYETFSADKATITVTGVSIHPGEAKDKMVNALHLAAKIADALPQDHCSPETTAEHEGFIHLCEMQGSTAQAALHIILRDFELDGLAAHGERVQSICQQVQAGEPRAKIECAITPQYRNMRYWLEKDKRPVELAAEAIEQMGLEPVYRPIRGGTDGSKLTERGLPCPNLFTGMQNLHGPLEYISLQDMAASVQMCLNLAQLWAEKGQGYQGWRE